MPAVANENKAMLDLMLKKGVITQKDYDQFMEANKDADENKAFKDSRIDQDVSKSIKFIQKRANDGNVKPSGFGFVSGDGKSEINLTGRMHFDSRFYGGNFASGREQDGNATFGDQFLIRRARIGFNGKILNDFNYEMVWNAAASDSSNVDTAWLNYGANKAIQFRAGRFKQPFNLEDYGTSSNNIDFIERSYVNQFNPGKKLGAMVHGVPMDGTVYALSVFQETNSVINAAGNRQFAARVATDLAKMAGAKDQVMHLGLAVTGGSYDVSSSSTSYSLASIRSESQGVTAFSSTFTGSQATGSSSDLGLTNSVSKQLTGLELVYANGPTKLQGEYALVSLTGYNMGTATAPAKTEAAHGTLKVGYLAAVYNLTGENWSDNYKDGAFGSIKIKNNYDPAGSGMGAWQVGLRYSIYDTNDLTGATVASTTTSRSGNTLTAGLTWFINPNSRVMLNHSITSFDRAFAAPNITGAGSHNSESMTTIRAQYNF
jgi:phosphate-selective porin OprO/OprP